LRLRATIAVCEVDAAEVGQERAVVMMLELNDIGGRQIVRDEDRLLLGLGRWERARRPIKRLSTRSPTCTTSFFRSRR
jgi:hypothetical protein